MKIVLLALLLSTATACIEPFKGSHIQFELGKKVVTPCKAISKYNLKVTVPCTGDPYKDRLLYHYELWGTVAGSGATYLTSFQVQPHLLADPVDPGDLKKYEIFKLEQEKVTLSNGKPLKVGDDQFFDELSESAQREILRRMALISPKLAITSFSTEMYENPQEKKLHPDFFLGGPFQQTKPLNGVFIGQVEGFHPFNLDGGIVASGGWVRVDQALNNLDSLWITIEEKDPNRPAPKPSPWTYVQGTAFEAVRGTISVNASSPYDSAVTASFGVYPSLGEEEYF